MGKVRFIPRQEPQTRLSSRSGFTGIIQKPGQGFSSRPKTKLGDPHAVAARSAVVIGGRRLVAVVGDKMQLQETLQQILTDYPLARTIALEGHPLAQFIRGDAEEAVLGALGELGNGLVVQGSPGQGNWAAVPWIAVFDPAITTSATRGYYVVYLFHAEQPLVHLSLNQGTTAVREEFANQARAVLTDRAELMRKRVSDFTQSLPVTTI
jgi:MrcB-like, N-terminal domain